MTKRSIISVMAAVLLIFLILTALLFEIKEVGDYEWKPGEYTLDQPYGSKIFRDLLEERFDTVEVVKWKDTISTDSFQEPALYLCLASNIFINGEKENEFMEFISQGNEALLIANEIGLTEYYHELPIETYNTVPDSMIQIAYVDDSYGADTFSFKYYNDDFKSAKEHRWNIATHESDHDNHLMTAHMVDTSFFISNDYKPRIMGYESFGSGCIHYHTVPEVFRNDMALQSDYLPHFNRVFDRFSASRVILVEPKTSIRGASGPNPEYSDRSPLDFVFDQASLKWAYFTLMASLLLFILFKGKRKQKVIPILPKNENTSLEFVHTLSDLFLAQRQHEKLVIHMKDIFHNWVRNKYYLDFNDPLYADKLAKKSKVPLQDIEVILNRFENVSAHYTFNDDQMIRLSKRLDAFYEKAI